MRALVMLFVLETVCFGSALAGICKCGEGEEFVRGDVNDDGGVDISDAIFMAGYLYSGGSNPPCFSQADVNDDGWLNGSDPIYLMNHLFAGGAPPPPQGSDTCP